jgi:hypothetical protein
LRGWAIIGPERDFIPTLAVRYGLAHLHQLGFSG